MKAKVPWILLAVSLAFNIFFTVGYVRAWGRMTRCRGFKGRARIIARKLNLDDEQQQDFENILSEFEELRKQRAPQRDAFMAELIKDEPDEKKGDPAEQTHGEKKLRPHLQQHHVLIAHHDVAGRHHRAAGSHP